MYIEEDVTIKDSIVGPNVSIGSGSKIEGSTLSDTIVGEGCTVEGSTLTNSLVGRDAVVDGVSGEITIGDHSEVRVAIRPR